MTFRGGALYSVGGLAVVLAVVETLPRRMPSSFNSRSPLLEMSGPWFNRETSDDSLGFSGSFRLSFPLSGMELSVGEMGIVGRVFALGLSTSCRSGEIDEDTDGRDGIVGTVVSDGLEADVEAEGYADGGGIDTRLFDEGGGGGGTFSLASGGRDGSGAVGGVPAGEGDREPRRKLSLVGVADVGDLREVL